MSEQETRDKIARLTAPSTANEFLRNCSLSLEESYGQSGEVIPSKRDYINELEERILNTIRIYNWQKHPVNSSLRELLADEDNMEGLYQKFCKSVREEPRSIAEALYSDWLMKPIEEAAANFMAGSMEKWKKVTHHALDYCQKLKYEMFHYCLDDHHTINDLLNHRIERFKEEFGFEDMFDFIGYETKWIKDLFLDVDAELEQTHVEFFKQHIRYMADKIFGEKLDEGDLADVEDLVRKWRHKGLEWDPNNI